MKCSTSGLESVDLKLIEFDVTQEYPKKELELHDIADVNYVILEADEEYLFDLPDDVVITKNFLIAKNFNEQGFLFFDREGKAVSKASRKGEGPEEYIRADRFLYVEEEDNLYVVVWNPQDNPKIMVYNKNGVLKKYYSTPENMLIEGIYNYDKNALLFYFTQQQTPFGLFSKTDGSMTFLTDIFIEEPQEMILRFRNLPMPDGSVIYSGFFYFPGYYAVKNGNDFLLTEYNLDTIYRLTSDKHISPAIIRKPSVEMTDPKIALHSFIETSEYLFFSSVRREYDAKAFTRFPKTTYLIDKNNGQIYTPHITNKDFEGKELIVDPSTVNTFITPQIGKVYYHIEELTQADKVGKLKGKLKEAFDRMGVDDEYVFMLFELK